eukprot:SAG11_NODE_3106_length_2685_cov_1.434648_3_plen_67_part_00
MISCTKFSMKPQDPSRTCRIPDIHVPRYSKFSTVSVQIYMIVEFSDLPGYRYSVDLLNLASLNLVQ